ncbi:MAG: hypothetical protein WD470_04005 [Rhodospirillaceae bacterium]
MILLRTHRHLVGSLLALMLFAAAAVPGVHAAVAGPQLSFPVCTPDGAKSPGHGDEADIGCDLCPHLCSAASATAPGPAADDPHAADGGPAGFVGYRTPQSPRWELSPLSGRGPPSTIRSASF